MSESKRLVYGIVSGSLVILPEDIARAKAEERDAVLSLSTYGEARRLAEQGFFVPGLEDLEEEPADDDPYDATDTPEYTNGDWPAPAATLALDYLPEDLDDLGAQEEHFPNFPSLEIDPKEEDEVLRTVRARGYEITRNDGLINLLE